MPGRTWTVARYPDQDWFLVRPGTDVDHLEVVQVVSQEHCVKVDELNRLLWICMDSEDACEAEIAEAQARRMRSEMKR